MRLISPYDEVSAIQAAAQRDLLQRYMRLEAVAALRGLMLQPSLERPIRAQATIRRSRTGHRRRGHLGQRIDILA